MAVSNLLEDLVEDLEIEDKLYLDGKYPEALPIAHSTVADSLALYITALRKEMWIAQKMWNQLQKDNSTKDSKQSKKMWELALLNADRILLLSGDIIDRNSAIKLKMLLLPTDQIAVQYEAGAKELALSNLKEEDKRSLFKELLNSLLGKLKDVDPTRALEAFKEAEEYGLDDSTVISGHIYHNAGDAELNLSKLSDNAQGKIEHLKNAQIYWNKALGQYPVNRKADRDRVQEKIDQNA